jgi:hypothetical protein
MNEFARARTACAVVARGLVCERTGNKFFTSVFPFATDVVVVVARVSNARRLSTSLEGFASSRASARAPSRAIAPVPRGARRQIAW